MVRRSVETAAEASTTDAEIYEGSTGNSEQTNPKYKPIVKTYTGKGKYSGWEGKDGLAPGSKRFTDPSGDSVLLINSKGDSALYVPWPGEGGTRTDLK